MPVTCAVCGKKFTLIGELADHISETNKGMQGDVFAGFGEQMEEMMKDSKEMEQHSDAMRGFTHVRFYDKTGMLLPEGEVIRLHVATTAGAKWCIDCRANFANNFRLLEHYISTGHVGGFRETAMHSMREFEELERQYF